MDCVENAQFCSVAQKVQAFPTVRMFKDGEPYPPDYRDDRTVEAFINYVKNRLMVDEHIARLPPPDQEKHKEMIKQNLDEHPGCLLSGFLLVNRCVAAHCRCIRHRPPSRVANVADCAQTMLALHIPSTVV